MIERAGGEESVAREWRERARGAGRAREEHLRSRRRDAAGAEVSAKFLLHRARQRARRPRRGRRENGHFSSARHRRHPLGGAFERVGDGDGAG